MFQKRLEKIREQLRTEKLDAVLISDAANITYLSGYVNFSKEEREAYIFISQNFAYIITDARYTEEVKAQVPHLEIFERSHTNPIENLLKRLKKHKQLNLGIEENNLTVAEHKLFKKHFKQIKHFDLRNFRSIKTEDEIKKITEACRIGDLAFNYILKKIKVGVSEQEIAKELDNFVRSKGAVLSFSTIVAFGKNSAIPHHHIGNTVLGPESSSGRGGQIVLLDFGVKYENYCSDMTRTILFGKPTEKQKKIYKTVLEAQQKVVDAINSGELSAAKLFETANGYIKSRGFPAIPHSLGHGIGLGVHEHPSLSPKSKDILVEGMVFSIEPGVYLKRFGGVRIEDLFVLKREGLRQITRSQK